MAKEIITLNSEGNIETEMIGFQGRSCLKVAAETSRELEQFGVVVKVESLRMKDVTEVVKTQQIISNLEG